LTKAGIFVMPSRYEGFPMILLEAMQSGLACISFDCSGPDEIIDDEINGILVRQNDIQGLADAMIVLISDAGKRAALAENAKKKVQQYSASNIGRQWQELFGRLIRDTTK